jgi:hypothetical protein
MKLKEWNVWHNTTTHLFGLPDLHIVAQKVIESGLCRAVFHSDGIAYWKQNDEVITSNIIFPKDNEHFEVKLDINDKPDIYDADGLSQATLMHEYEKGIYSDFIIENLNYIRGILDVCLISFGDIHITLYPTIKIYENGVVTISYRIRSTNTGIDVDYLVDNFINLFKKEIHDIKLSPSILFLYKKDNILTEETNIIERIIYLSQIKNTFKTIHKHSSITKIENYKFNLCSIKALEIEEFERPKFTDIHNYIYSSIISSILKPREGIPYLLFGAKPNLIQRGGLWSNRPEVYILNYDGQPENVNDIEKTFGDDLLKVMFRNIEKPRYDLKRYIGDSLRIFDDMAIYLNEGIGLTIYSKDGIKNIDSSVQTNNDHAYFHQQIKAEFIDYIYSTYNQLREMAYMPVIKYDTLSTIREQVNYIKILLGSISIYGELNDYFSEAWNNLKINEIESQILNGIIIKIEKLKEYRDNVLMRFGFIFSFILGLVGGVSIVDMILTPLWQYYGFGDWMEIPEKLLNSVLYLGFVIILAISMLLLYKMIVRKKSV